MITLSSDFLPPVKDYACARTGNTTLTENLGVSVVWSYMPTLTPPNITKSTNFTNLFGTIDGYGFKYTGKRTLLAHICISISFLSSAGVSVQWMLSHMLGAGGGYDEQLSSLIPTTTTEFSACSLNTITELKENDFVRLIVMKTSSTSSTVSFLFNFSIVPIDYLD